MTVAVGDPVQFTLSAEDATRINASRNRELRLDDNPRNLAQQFVRPLRAEAILGLS